MSLKRSKYKYFARRERAEQFMDGELLFRSLSYFLQIEDGGVRGDHREGTLVLQPNEGLQGFNQSQNVPFHLPGGSHFDSSVKSNEVFILCAANSMTERHRTSFNAAACVQIERPKNLLARIGYELPRNATLKAGSVEYYSPKDPVGVRYAFPDMIAFAKTDDYAWQNEYRFVFSETDALEYGSTVHKLVFPITEPHNFPPTPPPPPGRDYLIKVKELSSICKLHIL